MECARANSYGSSSVASIMSYPAVYGVNPGVPNVYNEYHPDLIHTNGTKKGLCGFACVAAMGMQHTSITNQTALTVYYFTKNSTSPGKPSDPYPIGTNNWLKFAFSDIFGMTVTNSGGALSANQVKAKLLANKPMLCRLERTGGAHGVVLHYCTDNQRGVGYVCHYGSGRTE